MMLSHDFADALPELAVEQVPEAPRDPQLLMLNEPLAVELGLDPQWLRTDEGVLFLLGQELPDSAKPVAQAYAGHQFGQFNPMMGDGRAVLLGELKGTDGNLYDLHLKGSGPTVFSKSGDGRAPLGPVLREHLISEAMHQYGVPTTRSLAAISTGHTAIRERALPAGATVRVARSHLRVGTLQLALSRNSEAVLSKIADHAMDRFDLDSRRELFEYTLDAQAKLLARWLGLGFVHGVMNTDNMSLSGETIDYGPCAFLDNHDPKACFSSIDIGGRYAYNRQQKIAQWNMYRFAEAMVPVLTDNSDDAIAYASPILERYDEKQNSLITEEFGRKLGLTIDEGSRESATELVNQWRAILAEYQPDHTQVHRSLTDGDVFDHLPDNERIRNWLTTWKNLSPDAELMKPTNPIYIPRNHHVQNAIDQAVEGNVKDYETLYDVLLTPFTRRPGMEHLEGPGTEKDATFITFCGT